MAIDRPPRVFVDGVELMQVISASAERETINVSTWANPGATMPGPWAVTVERRPLIGGADHRETYRASDVVFTFEGSQPERLELYVKTMSPAMRKRSIERAAAAAEREAARFVLMVNGCCPRCEVDNLDESGWCLEVDEYGDPCSWSIHDEDDDTAERVIVARSCMA